MDSSKNPKVLGSAVGCCQKLITYHAVFASRPELLPELIHAILDRFIKVITVSVDIQLKILQSLLPLCSNYECIHKDNLVKVFRLCLYLLAPSVTVGASDNKHSSMVSGPNMIHNSAEATLRQLVILVFERAENALPPKAASSDNEMEQQASGDPASMVDAYCLFKDLCYLVQRQNGPFLGESDLNVEISLELAESILACHAEVFKVDMAMQELIIKGLLGPIKELYHSATDYSLLLRIMRIFAVFIKEFIFMPDCQQHVKELFLLLISNFEDKEITWKSVVSLEILRSFLGDEKVVTELFPLSLFDPVFLSIEHFHKVLNVKNQVSLSNPVLKLPLIDMLDKRANPFLEKSSPYNEQYVSLLVFQCILSICRASQQPFLGSYLDRLETLVLSYFETVMEHCDEEENLLTVKGYLVFGLKNLGLASSVLNFTQELNADRKFNLFECWFKMNVGALDLAKKTDSLAFSDEAPLAPKGSSKKKSPTILLKDGEAPASPPPSFLSRGWMSSITEYLHLILLLKEHNGIYHWNWAFYVVSNIFELLPSDPPNNDPYFTELTIVVDVFMKFLPTEEPIWNKSAFGSSLSKEAYYKAIRGLVLSNVQDAAVGSTDDFLWRPISPSFIHMILKYHILAQSRWIKDDNLCDFPRLTDLICENFLYKEFCSIASIGELLFSYYTAGGRSHLWTTILLKLYRDMEQKTLNPNEAIMARERQQQLGELVKKFLLECCDTFKGPEWPNLISLLTEHISSSQDADVDSYFGALYKIGNDCLSSISCMSEFITLIVTFIKKLVSTNSEGDETKHENFKLSGVTSSVHLNYCLTLVEVLWKIADEILKRSIGQGDLVTHSPTSFDECTAPDKTITVKPMSNAETRSHLLLSLLHLLDSCRIEDLQESLIQTLLRIITLHGRSSFISWNFTIKNILLPLLRVEQAAAVGADQLAAASSANAGDAISSFTSKADLPVDAGSTATLLIGISDLITEFREELLCIGKDFDSVFFTFWKALLLSYQDILYRTHEYKIRTGLLRALQALISEYITVELYVHIAYISVCQLVKRNLLKDPTNDSLENDGGRIFNSKLDQDSLLKILQIVKLVLEHEKRSDSSGFVVSERTDLYSFIFDAVSAGPSSTNESQLADHSRLTPLQKFILLDIYPVTEGADKSQVDVKKHSKPLLYWLQEVIVPTLAFVIRTHGHFEPTLANQNLDFPTLIEFSLELLKTVSVYSYLQDLLQNPSENENSSPIVDLLKLFSTVLSGKFKYPSIYKPVLRCFLSNTWLHEIPIYPEGRSNTVDKENMSRSLLCKPESVWDSYFLNWGQWNLPSEFKKKDLDTEQMEMIEILSKYCAENINLLFTLKRQCFLQTSVTDDSTTFGIVGYYSRDLLGLECWNLIFVNLRTRSAEKGSLPLPPNVSQVQATGESFPTSFDDIWTLFVDEIKTVLMAWVSRLKGNHHFPISRIQSLELSYLLGDADFTESAAKGDLQLTPSSSHFVNMALKSLDQDLILNILQNTHLNYSIRIAKIFLS